MIVLSFQNPVVCELRVFVWSQDVGFVRYRRVCHYVVVVAVGGFVGVLWQSDYPSLLAAVVKTCLM